jgi:hypothetical protein
MSTEAAPTSQAGTGRNGNAINNSPSTWKTLSTWKRVGNVTQRGRDLVIIYRDMIKGDQHECVIGARDLAGLLSRQLPCDLSTTRTGIDGTVVTSMAGRAFRSRSGRALVIRFPDLQGAEAMCPWSMLMKVLDGIAQAAPLSIVEEARRPPTPTPAPVSTFDPRAGMQAGFT